MVCPKEELKKESGTKAGWLQPVLLQLKEEEKLERDTSDEWEEHLSEEKTAVLNRRTGFATESKERQKRRREEGNKGTGAHIA